MGLKAIENSVKVTSTVEEPLGVVVPSVDDPPFVATDTIPIAPIDTTMAMTANIIKEKRKSLPVSSEFLVGLSDIFVTTLCVNNLFTHHSRKKCRVRHSINPQSALQYVSHEFSYLHYLNGTNRPSSRN